MANVVDIHGNITGEENTGREIARTIIDRKFRTIPSVAQIVVATEAFKAKKQRLDAIRIEEKKAIDKKVAEAYCERMYVATYKAIDFMVSDGLSSVGISPSLLPFEIEKSDGTPLTIPFWYVHYGGSMDRSYADEQNPFFESLFKELQTHLSEQGLYLRDESHIRYEESFTEENFHLWLSQQKPVGPSVKWHGLDRIPSH